MRLSMIWTYDVVRVVIILEFMVLHTSNKERSPTKLNLSLADYYVFKIQILCNNFRNMVCVGHAKLSFTRATRCFIYTFQPCIMLFTFLSICHCKCVTGLLEANSAVSHFQFQDNSPELGENNVISKPLIIIVTTENTVWQQKVLDHKIHINSLSETGYCVCFCARAKNHCILGSIMLVIAKKIQLTFDRLNSDPLV